MSDHDEHASDDYEEDLETRRQRNIEENKLLLAAFASDRIEAPKKEPLKRQIIVRWPEAPTRHSARQASLPQKVYATPKVKRPKIERLPKEPKVERPQRVTVPPKRYRKQRTPPPANIREEYQRLFPASPVPRCADEELRFKRPPSVHAAKRSGWQRDLTLAAWAEIDALLVAIHKRENDPVRWRALGPELQRCTDLMDDAAEACMDDLLAGYELASGQSFQAVLAEEDRKAELRYAEERARILAERLARAEEIKADRKRRRAEFLAREEADRERRRLRMA